LDKCYSGFGQDLYATRVLSNKNNGTFLDIGCAHPIEGNNSYLLEKEYAFTGICVDIDNWSNDFRIHRPTASFIQANALELDYTNLIKQPRIDYLSIDIDPGEQSLAALKMVLPVSRFSFITFEFERPKSHIQYESRELLFNLGYELIVDEVAYEYNNRLDSCEDWFVDTTYIDHAIINKHKKVTGQPKDIQAILNE